MQIKKTAQKKIIRCGVIGLGRSGWDIHLKCISKSNNYIIEAVSDINKSIVIKARKKFKCEGFVDYRELLKLKTIDLVVIATPTQTHEIIAKECIKHKKTIILEKPLTPKLADTINLKKLAKKYNTDIIPFFNFRFVEEFEIIKKIINTNLIGEIFLIKRNVSYFNRRDDWQSLLSEGGGIINAAAIHHIDQIIKLNGNYPTIVWKDIRKVISKGDAPDHCKILFKFKNNCIADLEVSWAEASSSYPWQIFGAKGSIRQVKNILECKWFVPKGVKKSVRKRRSYLSNEKINWKIKKYTLNKSYSSGASSKFYDILSKAMINNKTLPISLNKIIDLMIFMEKNKLK